MGGLIFSISISVSLTALLVFMFKGTIIRQYGSKMLYILTLLAAVRLIIPYSIQLPDKPIINIRLSWYIPVIMSSGAIISLLWQIGKYIALKNMINRDAEAVNDIGILSQYENIKSELFIDADIPLIASGKVSTPMLLNIFKPCIVMPKGIFSENERDMLLRHELMHYRSKDHIKKIFFAAVASVQWFNPLAWLLLREFNNSLEMLCDEAVIKNADRQYKKDYCYMLLKTGKNKGTLAASATYFSSKETLKMRISNIFSGRKKKSGGIIIAAGVLCLTFASSFLCSCTVETPDDVKAEMSRVKAGIKNEEEQSSTESNEGKISLTPVSEVTASAQSTIDEWNSKNGIFKFDNCKIMIPQVSEFPEYNVKIDAGLDTPQKKYEQFKDIEKKVFGENYFDDEDFLIVPIDQSNAVDGIRVELTLEQYLSGDDPRAILLNTKNHTMIEFQYSRLWYWMNTVGLDHRAENEDEYIFSDEYLVKRYDCMDCSEAELKDEYAFIDGKSTVAGLISCAEATMENFKYSEDNNINYKASYLDIYDRGDGTYAATLYIQAYYGNIPFVNIAKCYDETDEIKMEANMIGATSDCYIYHCSFIDEMITAYTNTSLSSTGNTITEIISINDLLELLKSKLSNRIVYDVEEIQLGYDVYSDDKEKIRFNAWTYPFYNIKIKTTGTDIEISVDAVTGDMNIVRDRT